LSIGSSSIRSTSSNRIYAAGRKAESHVWSHFKIDLVNRKCQCQVADKSGKVCGRVIAGRNTTNAKVHLKAFHKDTYIVVEKKEKETKQLKAVFKPAAVGQPSDSTPPGIAKFMRAPQKYASDSLDKQKRDAALVNMVVGCGLPMTTVAKPSFREYSNALDPKYAVPSIGKFNKLFEQKYSQCKEKLLETMQSARLVTIGMDIWTKKSYRSSYLGITACFFNSVSHKPVHALLNLYTIEHPHTGDMISKKFAACLNEWNIEPKRVFLIITDNGSNMTKAVKVLNGQLIAELEENVDDAADTESEQNCEDDETGAESQESSGEETEVEAENDADVDQYADDHDTELALGCDEVNSVVDISLNMECEADGDAYEGEYVAIQFEESFKYRRLPCVVHTLQLSLKVLDTNDTFASIATAARRLVRAIRCLSVATQQLTNRAGKSVIVDCPTRWSSCYLMLNRLVELQAQIRIVCAEVGFDCLSNSQWTTVENIVKLLRPVTEHTNTLQSDCSSLSAVVPAILDLKAHLKQSPEKTLASVLLRSVTERFDRYLSPTHPEFDVTPATACLLSPDVAHFLMTEPLLFEAAKDNVLTMLASTTEVIITIL